MGNFNKGKFSGGKGGRNFGGDRGGNRGYGGGRSDRPEMHRATCSDCGKSCEVPFRPSGDKPVFCSDCFENKGGHNSRDSHGGGERSFERRDSKPRFEDKRAHQHDSVSKAPDYTAQFQQINNTLIKILQVLAPAEVQESIHHDTPKSERREKAPKKEVDTVALKQTLTKAMKKKPTKKVPSKKAKRVAKKSTGKKKVVSKKKK